ncbi:hypothetical protein CQ476_40 [TM7 phage DolZOral124_53_65]|nr:hypothetical protein CQ476_40 [TM7 phage DolZOral124_53_65]
MKWLRLSTKQYIDTGIKPSTGYRVVTNMRMAPEFSIMPIFGSYAPGTYASSFNFLWLSTFDPGSSGFRSRLRADYGGAGDDTIFEVDVSSLPAGQKLTFAIDYGKTTTINGVSYTSPIETVGSNNNIYIGSINSGTPDSRPCRADFSEFIIYDAAGNELFHGMPAKIGSTEYSSTPAPSNCYWDTISGTYKQQAGGTGIIWFDDSDDDLTTKDNSVAQGVDYGMKVLAEGDSEIAYMNSKYPLFGADISSNESQFKTYSITLTGINSEPTPAYPSWVYNNQYYRGEGTAERTALTIDTGFKGGKIKSVLMQHNGVTDAQWQARARQYTYFSLNGTNINTTLGPVEKHAPNYTQLTSSILTLDDGTSGDIPIFAGQQGTARWNTLANFNGGTYSQTFWNIPQATVNIDSNGILTLKTSVPYYWLQRAFQSGGHTYRARWCDWAWYQGVVITVTVLNTPYKL